MRDGVRVRIERFRTLSRDSLVVASPYDESFEGADLLSVGSASTLASAVSSSPSSSASSAAKGAGRFGAAKTTLRSTVTERLVGQ